MDESLTAFISLGQDEGVYINAMNMILLHMFDAANGTTIEGLLDKVRPYTASKNDDTRARATVCVADIVGKLSDMKLSEENVSVLVTFFCERMKDYSSVKEVTKGVWGLVRNHQDKISRAMVKEICASYFKEVTVQSLPQLCRKQIFEVIGILFDMHTPCFADMGKDFVTGYIAAMDGEKDPRNLMICFRMVQRIFACIPLKEVESSVSELFDVYSCYFPITFNAAKNDPYGVSGDDLKIQMRACLTCHEAIAPFTLSLLLEKLDADETHIKIDCLEGITACAKSVGGKALCALPEASALLADVWAALKKECVYSSSGGGGTALTEESKDALQSVPEAAGDAIRAFVSAFCPDLVAGFYTRGLIVDKKGLFLEPLLQGCLEELKVPDSKLARAYCRMMARTALSASVNAFERLMPRFFSAVKDRFDSKHVQPSQRQALLELVANVVSACKTAVLTLKSSMDASSQLIFVTHPLAPYVVDILAMTLQAVRAGPADQTLAAISGIAQLITFPQLRVSADGSSSSLLREEDVSAAVALLSSLMFTDGNEAVRLKARSALVAVSLCASYEKHVLDITVPPVLQKLGKFADKFAQQAASGVDIDGESFGNVMASVVALSTSPRISELSLPFVMRLAGMLFQSAMPVSSSSSSLSTSASSMQVEGEDNQGRNTQEALRALQTVLNALAEIVTSHSKVTPDAEVTQHGDTEVVSLTSGLTYCIQHLPSHILNTLYKGTASVPADSTFVLTSAPLLACVKMMGTLAQAAHAKDQLLLVKLFKDTFLGTSASESANCAGSFQPLLVGKAGTPSSPLVQQQLIPLLTTVLSSVSTVTEQSVPGLVDLMHALLQYSLAVNASASHAGVVAVSAGAARQCLASCFNKLPLNSALFDKYVSLVLPQTIEIAKNASVHPEARLAAISTVAWLMKAIVVRSYKATQVLLGTFISLLSDDDGRIATASANAMFLIVSEDNVVGNHKLGGVFSPFYKQRIFEQCLPTLMQLLRPELEQTNSCMDVEQEGRSSISIKDRKASILLALSHILRSVPFSVYCHHLPVLLPLILQSVCSSSLAILQASMLHTFSSVVKEDPELVSSHLHSIFPALLNLAGPASGVQTRLLALETIETLSTLKFHLLYPFQTKVVRGLDTPLDDDKRIVRKAAVRCRNKWFNLTE